MRLSRSSLGNAGHISPEGLRASFAEQGDDLTRPHIFLHSEVGNPSTRLVYLEEGDRVYQLREFARPASGTPRVTAAFQPEGDQWVGIDIPDRKDTLKSGYLYDVSFAV